MSGRAVDGYAFETERLKVAPWHDLARRFGLDLAVVVAELLTARTTVALPESWQGEFTIERAKAWIEERDVESPTLLVVEITSGRPAGLVILAEVPIDKTVIDLRIGYVIAESLWGQGLASEVLAGLTVWAGMQPKILWLTGGVDLTNQASVRVLEKAGFRRISIDDDHSATYRLNVVT